MSGVWPPPPGEQPQQGAATPPTHPQPQPAQPQPAWTQPGWTQPLPPAHKPGAIPLRPLGLGDMLDGAFRLVRFNPGATVGASVLVAAVAMAFPLVATSVLTFTGDSLDFFSRSLEDPAYAPGTDELVGMVTAFGAYVVGAVLQGFGMILVAGMISHVAHAAALGRKLTLGQAWVATHGKRWRLVGLATVFVVVAVLSWVIAAVPVIVLAIAVDSPIPAIVVGVLMLPVLLAFWIFVSTRLYLLSVPALMLEQNGVFGAIGRAWNLSKGQFWRLLGISLLTAIIAGVASQIVAFPISIVGSVVAVAAPELYFLATLGSGAIAQVVAAAVTTPFTGAVTNLQYLDQRIRKESYEVDLMEQAGLLSR